MLKVGKQYRLRCVFSKQWDWDMLKVGKQYRLSCMYVVHKPREFGRLTSATALEALGRL